MNYFILTMKHKFFVLIAGLRIGANIFRLLKHDLSKLTPSEYKHYQKQFFGKKDDPDGFNKAWLHHQNTNDHHWEYWISRTPHNTTNSRELNTPLDMSNNAILEMFADWLAAGRAYNGKWPVDFSKHYFGKPQKWEWLDKNWEKISNNISNLTKCKLIYLFEEYNIKVPEQNYKNHLYL